MQELIKIDELTPSLLGSVDTVRQNSKRGEETIKIELDKILIREGFNIRKDYGDLESLADSIYENGQVQAGHVDVLEDGTFVLTDGHRRFEACKILAKRGEAPLFKAIVNPKRTTEDQRIIQMFTTQDNKKLEDTEVAELINRLVQFGYEPKEVAKKIGKSLSYISDMLEFASESPTIKKLVKKGNLSVNAAVKIKKAIPSQSARNAAIAEAIERNNGTPVKASDIIVAPTNSFRELKKALIDIDPADIQESKTFTHAFVTSLVNNELTKEEIEEYFKVK